MILTAKQCDEIRVSQQECSSLAGRMYPHKLITDLLDTCASLEQDSARDVISSAELELIAYYLSLEKDLGDRTIIDALPKLRDLARRLRGGSLPPQEAR